MAKLSLLAMAKHMQNKGYTLSQMIFILMIISILLIASPLLFKTRAILNYESERMKDILIYYQGQAIYKKKKIVVMIKNNRISTNEKEYTLAKGVSCGQHEISFNLRGNVNQAKTINCTYQNDMKEIVVNLGSGNVYIK